MDKRITKYAMPDEIIPITCEKCGAVFTTKNTGPLGKYPIRYSTQTDACRKCQALGHTLQGMRFKLSTWRKGDY